MCGTGCPNDAHELPGSAGRRGTGLPSLASLPYNPAPRFTPVSVGTREMKAYMCVICGYVYEEEKGDPASGIAAGTRWDDVPLSWRCPDCGAGKEDFEMVEV